MLFENFSTRGNFIRRSFPSKHGSRSFLCKSSLRNITSKDFLPKQSLYLRRNQKRFCGQKIFPPVLVIILRRVLFCLSAKKKESNKPHSENVRFTCSWVMTFRQDSVLSWSISFHKKDYLTAPANYLAHKCILINLLNPYYSYDGKQLI